MTECRITLLHEPTDGEPFLILNKPKGLPSAPLHEGDESAYTQAEMLFPELKGVEGKKPVEHGLIHRIDTETDGLLLIACTQDFYDRMMKVQSSGEFIKTYKAVCHADSEPNGEGFPPPPFWGVPKFMPMKISSFFRFYGPKNSMVRPVTDESGRAGKKGSTGTLYVTAIDSADEKDGFWEVKCSIKRGFKHQVRCHLAWCGLSVLGDKKYSCTEDDCELKFSATGLKFPLENGELFEIEL